jgi:hypothetical protein
VGRRVPRFMGVRGMKKGDLKAAPWSFARTLIRASLDREAELGMEDGDVLGPALEGRFVR